MKNLICAVSVMSMLVFAGVVSRSAGAAADDPDSIGKIMETLHKGKTSPIAALKTQLKSGSPDWSVVQKEAKIYAKHAANLGKYDPPKGDAASWKKQATAFATNAKALNSAAGKEDLPAAKAAFGKLGASCKACHSAHRED